MILSDCGLKLLCKWEGVRPKVYPDSSGFPTIGVGHLLTRDERTSGKIRIGNRYVPYKDGLSDVDILALLRRDVVTAERAVNKAVTVPLEQHQFDALVSFVFNIGAGAFKRSTLLKVVNEKRYSDVPRQLRRWKYSGGKVVQGLVNRRRKEIDLWNKPER